MIDTKIRTIIKPLIGKLDKLTFEVKKLGGAQSKLTEEVENLSTLVTKLADTDTEDSPMESLTQTIPQGQLPSLPSLPAPSQEIVGDSSIVPSVAPAGLQQEDDSAQFILEASPVVLVLANVPALSEDKTESNQGLKDKALHWLTNNMHMAYQGSDQLAGDVGTAIKCRVCKDRVSEDCSGKLVKCSKTVKRCQTIITEFKFEGLDQINSVYKNCSDFKSSNALYRSAVSRGFYQLRVKVCRKNDCNKKPLKFPPINHTLNGVKCPNCNVTGAVICEPNGVVQCVGKMTRCIYMAATFHRKGSPPVAYRGCTSAKNKKQYPKALSHRAGDVVIVEISKGV
ncbi:uncharacterized protein LOC144769724 [Lissotriton helveticus]